MIMEVLQAHRECKTLLCMEEPMTPVEFIIAFFCQVDDHRQGLPKHPQAPLWPSAVVTLGMLHALKGGSNRAFYRWLTKD